VRPIVDGSGRWVENVRQHPYQSGFPATVRPGDEQQVAKYRSKVIWETESMKFQGTIMFEAPCYGNGAYKSTGCH
jgi:hypothetical protein